MQYDLSMPRYTIDFDDEFDKTLTELVKTSDATTKADVIRRAVATYTRAKGRVHHFHRRQVAALRGPVRGRKRQRILNVRHVFLIERQLLAFGFVTNQHSRF